MTVPKTHKNKEEGGSHARSQAGASEARGESGGGLQRRTEDQSGVVTRAKGAATDVVERARGVVAERLSTRTERSAQDLADLADALRLTSRQLESNFASPMLKRAADGLERASDLIKAADAGEVMRKVEGFARREPLLFVGSALALGLIGGRFLKSSAEREHTESKTGKRGNGNGRRSRGGAQAQSE